MDAIHASGVLCGRTSQPLCHAIATQKALTIEQPFPQSQQFPEIKFLPPLHGSAQMRVRCYAVLLEKAETDLRHRNSAYAEAERFFTG
jgi:hypothetical protein